MYGFLALGKSRFLQKMFITLKAAPINSDFELVSVVKMLPIRKVEIITCPKMFEVKPEVGIIRYRTKPCIYWLLPVTKDGDLHILLDGVRVDFATIKGIKTFF